MPKRHNTSQPSRSNDMWDNLLQNPIPNYSPTGSSSAGQSSNTNAPQFGFASYMPILNPFSLPHDHPHRDFYLHSYHQSQQLHNQQYPSYPQYPQTPQSQPFQTTPPEAEAETEPDLVPETQPTQNKRDLGRGKGPRVAWSERECKILAERWVDASENPVTGNSQTQSSLWNTIMSSYNSIVDQPRSMDQLTGKWTKLARDVKVFNSIYKKLEALWESGNSDGDIVAAARVQFKDRTRRTFNYESAWCVLKDCPKFFFPEGVARNKRPMPEEDDCPINLDAEENPSPSPNPMEGLFSDDRLHRPPGRNTSRKSRRSSGSSDAASSGRYSSEEARDEVVEVARIQKETMKTIADEARKRTMLADKRTMFEAFKFLATPIPTNLPPDDLELLYQARAEIKRDYSSRFRPPPQREAEQSDDD